MSNEHDGAGRHFDYVIIGAGPAGLQLGYHLQKAGRPYLILEGDDAPGAFFKRYPRHRKLISINKVHTGYEDREINMRWDWNSLLSDSDELLFKNYSKQYFPDATALLDYLRDFAAHYRLNIEYGVTVARVSKGEKFNVFDQQGNLYTCDRLIVATGVTKLYEPDIEGLEHCEKYTEMSVDPQDFVNQRVLIIGKGNSGFETADNLIETASSIHIVSPNSIALAWKTKFVGHLRAINNNLLDTYQLKLQNVVLDAVINKIEKRGDEFVVNVSYQHANGEQEDLVYDRVLLCAGWRFDDSFFDESCRPEMACNGKFPAQTSEWESTSVPDLYFAGTLMQMRDFKKKQSGFIHGFRYNVGALFHILEDKYEGRAWPSTSLAPTPEALAGEIIRRVNVTSSLWQQTGFIGDLIVVDEGKGAALYYEDVPVDYVHEGAFGRAEHYYVVTLDFGLDVIKANPDPFAIVRVHKEDYERASLSGFIHPIIRRYSRGRLVSEHHVIEDLASEWKEDVHTLPLLQYLKENVPEKVTA